MPHSVLTWAMCYAMPGTDLGALPVPSLVLTALRTPDAMSGIDLGYAATHSYAMSGTYLAYGATHARCHVQLCPMPYPVLTWAMLLRMCYAMSGTDRGYAATRLLRLRAVSSKPSASIWY
eukprot:3314299-Rhodomonas_salina.1